MGEYRYGFNGKENDNEVKGEGNQQDYGMRIYDPRLGKFLSVDPLTPEYPELTPYQFASNRVIDGIDRDGLEFEWAQDVFKRIKSGYEASIKKIDESYTAASPRLDAAGRGLRIVAKALAPLRPAEPDDPQTIGEAIDNLKNIPSNLAKLPSTISDVYKNGTLEQKIEFSTALGGTILGSLKGRTANARFSSFVRAEMNWSWKSLKTFGHIFTQHGSQLKISQLADRARSFGVSIGQWTNNEKAAEFIKGIYNTLKDGENIVDLPSGLGQVVNADQSVISATKAIIVKNAEGATNALKTGYPIVEKVVR